MSQPGDLRVEVHRGEGKRLTYMVKKERSRKVETRISHTLTPNVSGVLRRQRGRQRGAATWLFHPQTSNLQPLTSFLPVVLET